MLGELWIINANSCLQLFFADSLGGKKYSFLKQQYKQMMPDLLQSHPSVCSCYTIYAAFHLLKFQQEEINRLHDVIVLSLKSNCMNNYIGADNSSQISSTSFRFTSFDRLDLTVNIRHLSARSSLCSSPASFHSPLAIIIARHSSRLFSLRSFTRSGLTAIICTYIRTRRIAKTF